MPAAAHGEAAPELCAAAAAALEHQWIAQHGLRQYAQGESDLDAGQNFDKREQVRGFVSVRKRS
jgi:hypothetical protein